MKQMFEKYPKNKGIFIFKLFAAVVFLWSCFFWAGVTIINFYFFMPEFSYLATEVLIGSLLITVSMVLMFLRYYIAQLPFCIAGTAVYLTAAAEMIDTAEKSIGVFKPTFGQRYMPVVLILIISLSLAVIQIWSVISKNIEEKNRYNNSPSKSILDD